MNAEKLRNDFAVLWHRIKGKPIIYLDSACQSLRPRLVVDKMSQYYNEYPACGARSQHKLGKRVDEEVAKAREIARKFFGARNADEIVFTKNTTEGINLVANSLGLQKGDVVITTDKEHNSNLIPWQMLAKNKGIMHEIVEFGDVEALREAVKRAGKKTKLVAMGQTSNLDGESIPAEELIKIAHDNNALVLLDGAQSAPHKQIDLKKLDADFFVCSGHKMLGPSGTGILYGKQELLEKLQPFIVGGDTVVESTYKTAEFEKAPAKFEAGLQNYAGIVGLGEALNYLARIGMSEIEAHDYLLNKKITDAIGEMDGLHLLGPKDARQRGSIFSFDLSGMNPNEVAIMLDESANVMVRSGAHCCHSWFNSHKMQGSVRASTYLYNTEEDVRVFIDELKKIAKFLR
jgi:cysteine desulfurase/selenocysteine lyase